MVPSGISLVQRGKKDVVGGFRENIIGGGKIARKKVANRRKEWGRVGSAMNERVCR